MIYPPCPKCTKRQPRNQFPCCTCRLDKGGRCCKCGQEGPVPMNKEN